MATTDAGTVGEALRSTLAAAPAALRSWLAALALPDGARLAIGGPDWATPWLLAAARAADHVVVGLYTADARVTGTIRCGYVARSIATITEAAVDAVVTGVLDPAVEARLRRAGYAGPVHGVLPAAPDALSPALPSELAMLLDAQQAEASDPSAAASDSERGVRLAALSALAGAGRFAHAYEAALGWEKHGRPDEAMRVFAQIIVAEDADAALRLRARFHLGRLCYEGGDPAAARQHLGAVLQATPDHRRAGAYLELIDGAAGGTA